MKIIKNTLELEIDEWSDPGDYPNAVAQFPLPSYDYVSEISGQLVIQLESHDYGYAWGLVCGLGRLYNLIGWPEYLQDEVEDFAREELPSEVNSVSWDITRVGNTLTLEVREFEADLPDPDWDFGRDD